MSKKVKKSKQRHESKIYHKQTHGSGFSGAMGKVAKIIGIAVLIIAIVGGLYVAFDYNKDASVKVLVDKTN